MEDKLVFHIPKKTIGVRDSQVMRISNDLANLIRTIDFETQLGTKRITQEIAEFCRERLVFEEAGAATE